MKKWVEKGVIRREMTRYKYMGLMGRYVTGVMWWAMTEMFMKGEGKNCGSADDGTGSERDKEKLNEGGGVGDEINENEGRIGEDDRDVDRGENCDRDGCDRVYVVGGIGDGSEDDGTECERDKEKFN